MRHERGDRDKRGDKKLWRLGAAEFIPADPNEHGSARTWARWIFLQVVAKRHPEVLIDLHTRATAGEARINTPAVFVQCWRLPTWTLPWVEATWRFSAKHPNRQPTYWVDRDDLAGAQVPNIKAPDAPEYDPMLETRKTYLERVHRYMDECEAAMVGGGFTKRPRKDPRAFEWLADRLVGRKSYADLWKKDPRRNLHRNAPRNACRELITLLEGKPAQK